MGYLTTLRLLWQTFDEPPREMQVSEAESGPFRLQVFKRTVTRYEWRNYSVNERGAWTFHSFGEAYTRLGAQVAAENDLLSVGVELKAW